MKPPSDHHIAFRPVERTILRIRPQPLQRQLLIILTLALAGTFVLSKFSTALFAPPQSAEVRSARRLAPVLLTAFDATWDQQDTRSRILNALAEATQRRIELVAEDRSIIASAGDADCPVWDVGRIDGRGWVRLCNHLPAWTEPTYDLGITAVIGVLIWALAVLFARRITAPLSRLRRVTENFDASTDRPELAMSGHDGSIEVASLRLSFERMAARVRTRVEAQQNLLAVVGHELKSPLARVQMHIDLAREGIDAGAQLDAVETELAELAALVDDVLASARIDFDALAQQSVDLADAAQRGAGDRVVAVVGDATVRGDPTLIVRLLAILIDNAHRHGAPPVTVSIHEDRVGEQVTVVVDDAGSGFGDERQRLLEPFERGSAGGGGLGLGLALAQRIAAAHNGSIALGDVPGGGGRVTVVFSE
ncbi:MAG: HAMP domain-containing sensor histidine kinase [Myxococcota bacterium]